MPGPDHPGNGDPIRRTRRFAPGGRSHPTVELALALRTAGLVWTPHLHDLFAIPGRDLDDRVFALSDMTIDLERLAGERTIMFNGAVEWSLDYIIQDDVVWLPTESQLRSLLGRHFVSVSRSGAGYRCSIAVDGEPRSFEHSHAADAYALALLDILESGGAIGRLTDGQGTADPA